ncbi:hypothetical protein IP92_04803 [Pseudoduganella flava]|uniref:Uncharacterized protein n=1 Tax=Pseudoduganella flava TaxID=871742 RepID=A0A562PHP1_9BURK|nr:hypothetical protein [Pseudoduganella flava]QGZ42595.1 hypothetical protein GO485_28545 [Pseudoduganella flava]TWI43750.1 hypothetical protein IP92_04803 [Pseudoduganella flava]
MQLKLIVIAAALTLAGTASAQSHSVTNMGNPPQTQADTKAGTEATPGRTATAHRNTNKQKDSNAGHKPSKDKSAQHKPSKDKLETSGSSETGERVSAGSSATATTGMGAGNGDRGAEGAMEIKPSEDYVNPSERHALDHAPKSGKK